MQTQNFGLEKYKCPATKVKCPQCGQKTFTRYIDYGTDEYLSDLTGRCDRENNCGYHYTPKEYFRDNPVEQNLTKPDIFYKNSNAKPHKTSLFDKTFEAITENRPVSYLPFDLMERSVQLHERSSFFKFLKRKFTSLIASKLCSDYFIGTNKNANTVFRQVDFKGQIRQSKVMQYDPSTGKRDKEFATHFIGKTILNDKEANLQQCFFGEYLLNCNSKPCALVESEKSAAIASVYFPNYIWLATGGKHGAKFTESKVCKVLAGRSVIMFPDVKAYSAWKEKGELLASVAGCKVIVSDLLHNLASDQDREEDCDIADYLLRNQDSTGLALTDHNYPIIWDYA